MSSRLAMGPPSLALPRWDSKYGDREYSLSPTAHGQPCAFTRSTTYGQQYVGVCGTAVQWRGTNPDTDIQYDDSWQADEQISEDLKHKLEYAERASSSR